MQEKLIILRKKQGVTQRTLAEFLNITTVSYCNKELGIREFKLGEMFALANYFNKNIGDIFMDECSQIENIKKEGQNYV